MAAEDLGNPNAKGLLSELMVGFYMGFLAILFSLVSQLYHPLSRSGSEGALMTQIRIAVVFFVINFVAVICALQQITHHPGAALTFRIIYYITMVLTPGIILYILVLQSLYWDQISKFIHDKIQAIGNWNFSNLIHDKFEAIRNSIFSEYIHRMFEAIRELLLRQTALTTDTVLPITMPHSANP